MKGNRKVYIEVGFYVEFPDSTDGDALVQAECIVDHVKELIKSYEEFKDIAGMCTDVNEENDEADDIYDEDEDNDPYEDVYWLPQERKAERQQQEHLADIERWNSYNNTNQDQQNHD